ncbi:MAG: hypothetical protein AAF304_10405, partial [Pseudomonadota bacterium]
MAEVDIQSTINLNSAPNGCANCSTSGIGGHVQGASGNFAAHFNNLLKEGASNGDGQVLPLDGKKLPHEVSLTLSNESKTPLSLLNRNSQLGPSVPNGILNNQKLSRLELSNALTIDSNKDLLSEGIDAELSVSQLKQQGITTQNSFNTKDIAGLVELQNVFDTKV